MVLNSYYCVRWSHVKLFSLDFVRWVNSIVEAHLGSSIDDFKVIFDLDINNELTIDKWVVFALSKQVKRLELNFTPGSRLFRYIDCYTWPPECRLSSLGYHRNLSSLRSLCLKYVNMNDEDIKCILLSCHDLENLCIISGSLYLKRIEIPHASLQLKHLEVACLPKLLCIDILTPKLVSLTYQGHPIKLNIRDAALLSDVSIGNGRRNGEVVTHAYRSLAKYFPQLTSLSWDLLLNPESGVGHIKVFNIYQFACCMFLQSIFILQITIIFLCSGIRGSRTHRL